MTTIITGNGEAIGQKEYVKLAFEQHLDKASWISTWHCGRSHLILEHDTFSPSICGRMFITKDLIPSDVELDVVLVRCRMCQRAIEKLNNKGS